MTSIPHQQRPNPPLLGLTAIRKSISFLFLSMLAIYLLYSSKLLFFNSAATTDTDTDTDTTTTTETYLSTSTVDCSTQIATALSNASSSAQLPIIQTVPQVQLRFDTQLNHVVFGIAASASLWETRKEYIKLWWQPGETRGVVWLEQMVKTQRNEKLPEIRISGDTSKFPYTNRQGLRSALRISRVVSETLRLGMKDVRWFVMGDDDTVFVVDNVVRILSKYDHNQYYYIGCSSESHVQNIFFSYAMAYGGGGFAISYPLARELEKMQDRCIQRYPGLYGSDDRIQACMAELGVPLTKETGFHQYDVYGNLLGLLGAHPVTPLASLHHLDVVDPIFPNMNRVQSLRQLLESAKFDSASLIQQSICYDKKREWSISVSWGYAVQIVRGIISPRELETPTRTFLNWYKRLDYTAYAFNTRPVTRHPCQKPFVFYMSSTKYDERRRQIIGVYTRHKDHYPYCRWRNESPERTNTIVVLKREDSLRWQKSPRKDCCRVLQSRQKSTMYLWVGNCRQGGITSIADILILETELRRFRKFSNSTHQKTHDETSFETTQ